MCITPKSSYDHRKYRPFPIQAMPGRQWPDRRIEAAPRWCSEDLRDGNQALTKPLTAAQKKAFFGLLTAIGFKEIVIGFPSASEIEFRFVRMLIEQDLIPDDVTVSVLTPARPALIERSFEALKGVERAIVHLYNSTSKVQRERVFGRSRQAIVELAVAGAECVQRCAEAAPETDWRFEYTPESFTATEPDFAVEICNAVASVWRPTVARPVIFNLPATVENTLPNVYADRIEWFASHIEHREAVILSVHTHNDRGCAVAAAEMALLAGAQRVEGTLFGNGERTGNADLLVMAMNLYSQGIDPGLDFSDIGTIAERVSAFNRIPVHPRHPYAGDLVYTAFSGSHQDAIKKCLDAYRPGEVWDVAYLPIDPADVGRDYREVVRINSQSGKGGAAYVVERELGYRLPRWLQIEFGEIVQRHAEDAGGEIAADQVKALFEAQYRAATASYRLLNYTIRRDRQDRVSARIEGPIGEFGIDGSGDGALSAFVDGLQRYIERPVGIVQYDEHALSSGTDALAVCYILLDDDGVFKTGIASHRDSVTASFEAVLRSLVR
ncbi:MAG: 2-isopropylmalate synthase [Gammaproteobacteria bacterium]